MDARIKTLRTLLRDKKPVVETRETEAGKDNDLIVSVVVKDAYKCRLC